MRLELLKILSSYCLGSRRGTEVVAVLLKKRNGSRTVAATALECRDGEAVVRRQPFAGEKREQIVGPSRVVRHGHHLRCPEEEVRSRVGRSPNFCYNGLQ